MPCKSIILLVIAGLFLGASTIGQRVEVSSTNDVTPDTMSISQSQPNSGQQMNNDNCAACHGFKGRDKGLAVPFFKAPAPRRLGERFFHSLNEFQEMKSVLMPRRLHPAKTSHRSSRPTPDDVDQPRNLAKSVTVE